MLLGAYTFGQVMWSMLVFFAWIIWFWMLITVFGDLFSRHDIGGGKKTLWFIFVLFFIYLGVLVYLIAEGKGMGERSMARAKANQKEADEYIRSVAGSGSADEIARGKELLDSGAITQAEFDQLKAKALAGS